MLAKAKIDLMPRLLTLCKVVLFSKKKADFKFVKAVKLENNKGENLLLPVNPITDNCITKSDSNEDSYVAVGVFNLDIKRHIKSYPQCDFDLDIMSVGLDQTVTISLITSAAKSSINGHIILFNGHKHTRNKIDNISRNCYPNVSHTY